MLSDLGWPSVFVTFNYYFVLFRFDLMRKIVQSNPFGEIYCVQLSKLKLNKIFILPIFYCIFPLIWALFFPITDFTASISTGSDIDFFIMGIFFYLVRHNFVKECL